MAARRGDIDRLRGKVGTFDAPIGAVQLPATGVQLDRAGNPRALQSGQDEHPEPAPREARRRKQPEPQLEFTTDLFAADPVERSVLAACHKVLAGRQVTVSELRTKLVARGFDEEAVDLGVERCTSAGLLDDRRYAEAFAESRVRRGHGAQRIRQDLARRGIDRSLVDAALEAHQETGALDDAAVEAARRRFARVALDDAAARSRALRWLLARGYSSGQASAAIRVVHAEQREQLDAPD